MSRRGDNARTSAGRRGRRAVGMGVAALVLVLVSSGCVLKGSWTETTFAPVADAPPMRDVSCPAADACIAVGAGPGDPGEVHGQVWDGQVWDVLDIDLPVLARMDGWIAGSEDLSCWSASGCGLMLSHYDDDAVDIYPTVFLWDGSTWTRIGFPAPYGQALECWAADGCVGYDPFNEEHLVWDGAGWEPIAALSFENPGAGTCLDASTCRAPSQWEPWVHHLDGGVHVVHPAPFFIGRITCAAADVCHGVSSDRTRLAQWDGATWTERTLYQPDGQVLDVRALDCSSVSACVAVGFRSVDGGPSEPVALGWWGEDTWARIAVPDTWPDSPTLVWEGFDCVTGANRCVALARTGGSATDVVPAMYAWP